MRTIANRMAFRFEQAMCHIAASGSTLPKDVNGLFGIRTRFKATTLGAYRLRSGPDSKANY
jgi:hypothetical protein